MNLTRRRFAGTVAGTGALLVTGLSLTTLSASASSRSSDDEPTEDEILASAVASWQRSYECDDPVTFVTAVAVEFDKKRNAADAFDYMRESGLESFEDFEVDDEGDLDDLSDQGYYYVGVSGTGADEVPIALLYAQQGTYVYAIVSAGLEDQLDVVTEYYELLFDENREEADVLLTEDEMPRGFVITEDAGGDLTEEDPEDEEDDDRRSNDDDEEDVDEEEEEDDPKSGRTQVRRLVRGLSLPGHTSR